MKADLNFYASYRATNKQLTLRSRVTKLVAILVIIIIGAIVFATLVLAGLNAKSKKDINSLEMSIESQKVIVAQIEKDKLELASVNKKRDAIKDVQVTKMLDRMITKEEINKIYACLTADTFIEGASYLQSTMVLVCTSDSKDSPTLCAEKLNAAGIATTVGYTGFVTEEVDKNEKRKFTLSCRLKYSDSLVQYLSDQLNVKKEAEKKAIKEEAEKKAAQEKESKEAEGGAK